MGVWLDILFHLGLQGMGSALNEKQVLPQLSVNAESATYMRMTLRTLDGDCAAQTGSLGVKGKKRSMGKS